MTDTKKLTKPVPEMLDYEDCRPGPSHYPKNQAEELKKDVRARLQRDSDRSEKH